jgi:hypothetical protein
MAEVYRRVGGMKTEKFLAKLGEVQDELDDRALEIGTRAEALLAEHYAEGDASIDIEVGKVDRYIILDDEAALSIEYGREDNPETGQGGMEGLYILHRAAHLKDG